MIISSHHPEHAYILTKKIDTASDEQAQGMFGLAPNQLEPYKSLI